MRTLYFYQHPYPYYGQLAFRTKTDTYKLLTVTQASFDRLLNLALTGKLKIASQYQNEVYTLVTKFEEKNNEI